MVKKRTCVWSYLSPRIPINHLIAVCLDLIQEGNTVLTKAVSHGHQWLHHLVVVDPSWDRAGALIRIPVKLIELVRPTSQP